jgi:hypothetical protein
MAPNNQSEIVKMQDNRVFVQYGGAGINNQLYFSGIDSNYAYVKGVTRPQLGGVDPINVGDPNQAGAYRAIARSVSAPGLPTFSIELMHKAGVLPRHALLRGCAITAYVSNGACKTLSNIDTGFLTLKILSGGLVTDVDAGDVSDREADDPIMTTLSITAQEIYDVTKLQAGELDSAALTAEVMDLTYGDNTSCAECGPADDGTQRRYVLVRGAAAAAPFVRYTTDGGTTWTSLAITGSITAEAPVSIKQMGDYLIVLSPTGQSATQSAIYYTTINKLTGVPVATWTKIAAGFTVGATRLAADMTVINRNLAFICGGSGEILKLTDPTAGVTSVGTFSANALTRIRHTNGGDVIVAVGAAGTVLISENRGGSFGAVTTSPGAGLALTALEVFDANRILVGAGNGQLWYTDRKGEAAWVQEFVNGAAPTAINDILFVTPEIGYVTYVQTDARVAATVNGGSTWGNSSNAASSRIGGIQTTRTRFNRVAAPLSNSWANNSNYAMFGGVGTGGVVGVVAHAAGGVF